MGRCALLPEAPPLSQNGVGTSPCCEMAIVVAKQWLLCVKFPGRKVAPVL